MQVLNRTLLNKNTNPPTDSVTLDMDPEFVALYELYKKYTMTSIERMFALYCATRYVALTRVPGDIVECGVWKGGSAMLCAAALLAEGERDRSLYLYDTCEGMTEPTDRDVDYLGKKAKDLWWKTGSKEAWEWTCASLDEVEETWKAPDILPSEAFLLRARLRRRYQPRFRTELRYFILTQTGTSQPITN